MSQNKDKEFREKHGPDVKPNSLIKDKILKCVKNDELSCSVAFEIAKDLKVSAAEIGINLDLLNFKLIKCQLGLFGYKPKKKIVKPQNFVDKDLKDAICGTLVNGKLPCKSAWDVASRFNVHKMTVSFTCEAMDIKISNCQLGAF